MSERPTSRMEMLVETERKLYTRVQAALNNECSHVEVETDLLDRMLSSLMGSRFDVATLKADVEELKVYGEGMADMIVGLAKLLEMTRKQSKRG